MFSASVPTQRFQTTSLELPGGRNFTLAGGAEIDQVLLQLTPTSQGLITSIQDERVQNLLSFDTDTPGVEWRTGRDSTLQTSFYLPSGTGRRNENAFATARQVVDASWERREVVLTTQLHDPNLQRHEIRARFDECGRIIPETITASTQVVVGDGEFFLADGRRYEGPTRI